MTERSTESRNVKRLALIFTALLWSAGPAAAQESLTVVLLPGAVSFSLSSGNASNAGSTSIVATTTWTLLAGRTQVALYAYFSNAAAALTHTATANTVDIPSSRIQASVNGGALAAFDQTVTFGAAGGGRQLFAQPISIANRIGSRADTIALNINLSDYALPADTYSGSLRLRAQATP